MNDPVKKKLWLFVKVCVTTVLVLVLILKIDWYGVWLSVAHMHVVYVIIFSLLYVAGLWISAWKWSMLARHVDFAMPLSFYVRTYLLGTFLNNFFPSFVGGDTYRIIALGKSHGRMMDSAASVIVDRVSGLFVLLFYAVIFMGGVYGMVLAHGTLSLIWYGVIICFVMGCAGIFAAVKMRHMRVFRYVPAVVRRSGRALLLYCDVRSGMQAFASSSIFVGIGIVLANYMLFLACDVPITFWQYASVILLTNVIAAVPISFGNIGTKEWAYVFLFGLFGVQSSVLVAIVLVSRVIQMAVSFCAIPLFIQEKNSLQKK